MREFKHVFFRSIIYCLPVLSFYFYLEFRLSRLENSYSKKIKNFDSISAACDVLILGNSQMLKGVNPDLLSENAFNMAQVSQTLTVDKAILEQFINKMPSLKVVVVGVGYTSFGEKLEKGDEAWRLSFYKAHYGLSLNPTFEVKDYSYTLRYQPYEALKLCLKNFKVDLTKGYQSNGWLKMQGIDSTKLSNDWAKRRAMLHTKSLTDESIIKNKKALIDLITIATQHRVRVILVRPPVMSSYSKYLNLNWQNCNATILNAIKKETGLEVLTFNLFGKEHGFNDVDHLNEEGAKAFSDRIAEVIK